MKLMRMTSAGIIATLLALGVSTTVALPASARETRENWTPLNCSTRLYSYGYATGYQRHRHEYNGANRSRTFAGDINVPQQRLDDSGFKAVTYVLLYADGFFWNGDYGRRCDY